MAKLKDLVNVNINRDVIHIQGVEIPVIFTFESFPFVEEAYGEPYHIFEKELNKMMKKQGQPMGSNEIKLMYSLIYGMVRSGGTETNPTEIKNAIPISDLINVFYTVIEIFNNQTFQGSDAKKIQTEKKS